MRDLSAHQYTFGSYVGDIQAGLALIYRQILLAYTHIWGSRAFDGQPHPEQFGAFTLSFRF
jgi:hypothetical protein